jgi:hypothetical protein
MKRTVVGCCGISWGLALGAMVLGSLPSQAQEENAPTIADSTNGVATFSGVDFAKDSTYVYSGVIVSLVRDLGKSGPVLRLSGASGDFDYTSDGTKFDGNDFNADVALGYMFVTTRYSASIYVGVDYRDIDIEPFDASNDIQGTEVGFKVLGDFETSEESPFYVSVNAAYSTAFEAWYALLRLGYNTPHFAIGPEGLLSSEEGEDTQRLGGFMTYRFDVAPNVPAEVTAYGGKQFVDDEEGGTSTSGGEGAYGGLSLSLSF